MSQCTHCGGRAQLYLCGSCQTDLRDMLTGLAIGQDLGNGRRSRGFIQALEDAVLGDTRLGESARRSTERNTPLPVNLLASQLLENVHNMLGGWVRHLCESRGTEIPTWPPPPT